MALLHLPHKDGCGVPLGGDLLHEVPVPLPQHHAGAPGAGEARRVTDDLVGHFAAVQRVLDGADDPCRLSRRLLRRCLLRRPLATPTAAAQARLAAVEGVLVAAADARRAAPLELLLVAGDLVASPQRALVRHDLSGRRLGLRRRHLGRRDAHVADHALAGARPAAALLPAGWHVHPLHGLRRVAPVGDPQAHSGLQDIAERLEVVPVAALVSHHHLAAVLPEGRAHADQGAVLLRELRVHLEGIPGVDLELAPRAVRHVDVLGVLSATATVAARVVPVLWRVAAVRRGLQRMVVGLHEVDLRAPLATHLVGVAIVGRLVIAVRAAAEFAAPTLRRRRDQVHGQVARTSDAAQVDREGNRLTEQGQLHDAFGCPVRFALRKQAEACVVLDRQRAAVSATAAPGHIEGPEHPADGECALHHI
mmetsp:Transcript_405/g.1356  ORF Transcript_405/g.1356 Transcript_405/m.1356 type:complete len:421 (-) Transcript_405:144-1406(-)